MAREDEPSQSCPPPNGRHWFLGFPKAMCKALIVKTLDLTVEYMFQLKAYI